MRILNLGSLNVDRVYQVEHFASAGESILATEYESFCGGKGLNQSIALARSGGEVFHAGAIGADGGALRELLEENGVDTRYLKSTDTVTGHAIIQVDAEGQNCIIVSGGANQEIAPEEIDRVLEAFGPSDLFLTQNEVSNVAYAIRQAKNRGMRVAFNAAPMTAQTHTYPLALVDYLIVNEVEGRALLGEEVRGEEELLRGLCGRYPDTAVILTVGEKGAYWGQGGEILYQRTCPVTVVDSTAAGDTFCGYFITAIAAGRTAGEAMYAATLASCLAIQKKGAAPSIPSAQEVEAFRRTADCPPAR